MMIEDHRTSVTSDDDVPPVESKIIDLYELPLSCVSDKHRNTLRAIKGYCLFARADAIGNDVA